MTDEEKMKLALEAATEFADKARKGKRNTDTYARIFQSYFAGHMAAIIALAPRLEEAEDLLRCCADKGHSYESEGKLHDMVHAFLKQGEAS